jgi:propanol-preferring alcohol dehydrogenase
MRAMVLREPRATTPTSEEFAALELADVPVPEPAEHEVLVRVSVCGVCRTDLDVAEGRVIAPHYPVIPGHQIVGRVAAVGRAVSQYREGDRLGVAWIHSACGVCRWCRNGDENLCPYFKSTGCDADGGYAEYATVPADFAHAIPAALHDVEAAPLLCAGAVGWRSLSLTGLEDGDPLGLTGFGASGHLVLQIARHRFPRSPIYVFARSAGERAFARELGAAWAGDTADAPPEPLAAIIDTTPAWKPVVESLSHLMPGGRLVVNAIRKTRSDQNELQRLDYATHLWMEREIKSVANVTRADVRALLSFAVNAGLRPTVEEIPLEQANAALARLRGGTAIHGATVLRIAPDAGSL